MDLITVTRKEGLEFNVRVRGHDLTVDLPEKDGGGDQGPTPVELLGESLGTCIAVMIQGYCRRHGYEGDVGVSLTMELADNPKRVAAIVVAVELPKSFPEDKMDAVRRIADLCPVHQTLRIPPRVDIDIT
jgi:uncharacterized OsmC-like protein